MRIKELKEILSQYPDNYFVCLEHCDKISALTHVYNGVNEADCTVFITDYTEED